MFLTYFDTEKDEQSWFVMFDYFSQLGIAGLCIILTLPIISGKGTILCTPIAFLTLFVMLAIVSAYSWVAEADIRNRNLVQGDKDSWLGKCLDDSENIDVTR